MALAPNYESLEEAQRRLLNTVVMYDGEPVYVTDVRNIDADDRREGAANNDIVRVEFKRLPVARQSVTERKYISSRKFDFSPFKMGMLEYNEGLYFLSRTTGRQQQQGLSQGNLSVLPINDCHGGVHLNNLVGEKSFYDCIKGSYKSFEEALESKSIHGSAFSRSFALHNDRDLGLSFLFHKNNRCGWVKDKCIVLGPAFKYLSNELESCNAPL